MQVRLEVSIIVIQPPRGWRRLIPRCFRATRLLGRTQIMDDEGPSDSPLAAHELTVVATVLDELAADTFLKFANEQGAQLRFEEPQDVRF